MKIICLSTNLELALLRSALLRSQGIEVDFPQSKKETIKLIETETYDAAVVCHSLSNETAEEFAQEFRTHHPGKCLICLTRTPWERPRIKADVFISGIDGPEPLLEAIRTCAVDA
jgi:DNA-binding response OmpR family regulator